VARGGPDWNAPDYQLSAVQVDTADIADRLLGFARLDQRGRIVVLETWRDGLGAWLAGFSGTGVLPAVMADNSLAFVGTSYMQFDVGATLNSQSYVERNQYLGEAKRIGLEASLVLHTGVADANLVVSYQRRGGTDYSADLRYRTGTDAWRVVTGAAVSQVLDVPGLGLLGESHVQVKLVADFETGFYSRLLLGEIEYDLSEIPLRTDLALDEGKCLWQVGAIAVDISRQTLQNGYIILTKDEP
jgi:hypothetical protein